jgi:hypothetical protein
MRWSGTQHTARVGWCFTSAPSRSTSHLTSHSQHSSLFITRSLTASNAAYLGHPKSLRRTRDTQLSLRPSALAAARNVRVCGCMRVRVCFT